MKRAALAAIATLLLVLCAGAAYRAGLVPWNEPAAGDGPRGIDVSHHQGRIEWDAVAGAGVRFAYLKATEGRDFRDPRFRDNWMGAEAAGIARGAYHFFTFCSPGRAQAEHFLRVAPPVRGALLPAADVEFRGNCKGWRSLDAVPAELRAFLDAVERAWGAAPILYVTPEAHARVLAGRFGGHSVWVRDVLRRPAPDAYGGWLVWQFSETGRVAGIAGAVDLDVLRPGAALGDLMAPAR
jgi:lysozyme